MSFQWINQSEIREEGSRIEIMATPQSDFFCNSGSDAEEGITPASLCNAPYYYTEVEGDFVLKVKVSHEFRDIYDSASVMVMADMKNWAKGCFEKTDFGDLTKMTLKEAWGSEAFQKVRRAIAEGRQNYPFCKHCDFIDAGFRMQLVNAILSGDQDAANKLGGHERMKIGKKNNEDDNIK